MNPQKLTPIRVKEKVQFLFLCNLQNSDASQICITFFEITQKILTNDVFHWLEVIAEVLSFLQKYSM